MSEDTKLLTDEILAWASRHERLRTLLCEELGLPDADAISRAEERGYQQAQNIITELQGELDRVKAELELTQDIVNQAIACRDFVRSFSIYAMGNYERALVEAVERWQQHKEATAS